MRQPRGKLLVELIGVLVLSAVAGCGGSSIISRSSTTASTEAPKMNATGRAPKAKTPHRRPQAGHHPTSSTHAALLAPAAGKSTHHPIAPGGRNVGATRTYSGTGNTTIGTITLTRDAVLHWSASVGGFTVSDASHKLRLSGRGTRGQGFAPAGSYTQVRVIATGKWTLQIQLLGAPK